MAERTYSVSVPAEPGSLGMLRAFFEPMLRRACPRAADAVILALDEACSNVVKHRARTLGATTIDVLAHLDDRRVRFRIARFCRAEDRDAVRPRPLDEDCSGGLGTAFIARLMDVVAFEAEAEEPGALALILEKALDGEGGAGG